jgi:predicted GNAT family N-acyltransferase
MNELQIKQVDYQKDFTSIATIRREVFQEEQKVPPEIEFDGLDETAIHLLAYLGDRAVGTTRIRYLNSKTAKIERLAVLSSARGLGIGKQLMEAAIAIVKQNQDCEEIIIHAQEYIKDMYQQLGFELVGDRFFEGGIPHVKMVKQLRI